MFEQKPIVIFDGDCGFCRRWIVRWKEITGDALQFEPYQKAAPFFPAVPLARFRESVHLIETGDKVYSGAEAVFRVLAYDKSYRWIRWLYENFIPFSFLSEKIYSLIAAHRVLFSQLTRFFWGEDLRASTYRISSNFFIKGLAIIYFIAFASLGVQILGLVGSGGISPAGEFLRSAFLQVGPKAHRLLPTLAWLNASDSFLKFLCWGGATLSVFLLMGIFPSLLLFLLWIFYLSLVNVGQDFLAFQWDSLLLEVGFLAIFLVPPIFYAGNRSVQPTSRIRWLLAWLLFRLIYSSGVVKLASHDESWRHLTALMYHYETQPLPNPFSWSAYYFPPFFQKFSTLMTLAIELLLPFFIFMPRNLRHFAGIVLVGFQVMIMLTGNYTFFNLLTILLCLLLFDDVFWRRPENQKEPSSRRCAWPNAFVLPLSLIIFLTTWETMVRGFGINFPPNPITVIAATAAPFRVFNSYGLFAVMTTRRPEIVMEGSDDGKKWFRYEFRYKPGYLKKAPHFVAPHQPRLDWQMWFAALGNAGQNPWFLQFCVRLLEGAPEVLKLLANNPFPEHPPRYIRAVAYDYHFSDPESRRKHGKWWTRDQKRIYLPPISLKKEATPD